MRARAHLIHLRETTNFLQVRDATGVHNRGANKIDELFLDELLAIIESY